MTATAREERLAALLHLIRERGGRWPAGRLHRIHRIRRTTGGPVQRGTARRDLAELARRGHLDQHGPADGRYYQLRKDSRS